MVSKILVRSLQISVFLQARAIESHMSISLYGTVVKYMSYQQMGEDYADCSPKHCESHQRSLDCEDDDKIDCKQIGRAHV